MFTGLIQKVGRVKRVSRGKGLVLEFAFEPWPEPLAKGESVAVNGVCLTVVDCDRTRFTADVLGETETRTGLAELLPGAHVNLERAMKLGGRLGGHIVTGHVDFCSKVLSAGPNGDDYELRIAFPHEQRDYFAPKGSVAVNGVSLTIASLADDSFTVCLIPVTRNATNLNSLSVGSLVNIETDILGKYVVGALRHNNAQGITMETLINAGF